MSPLAVFGGKPVYQGNWPKWPVSDQREVERVVAVVRSGTWAMGGPQENAFRRNFCRFLGVSHGICVTNGTHALQLALEALDIGAGDEVIVPGLTWQATAACALDINAIPILVDIDPNTLCMAPRALRAALSPRTKAVIAVHYNSCMADLDALLELTEAHGLPLIEDCAHQHGSEWRGRKAGSWGKLGTFSMQQSKVLTSGEGGFVSTSDPKLGRRLECLRHCGRPLEGVAPASLGGFPQSGNYRLGELQAALLNTGLERLPEQTARREENARLLSSLLSPLQGLTPPPRQPQVTRQAYYCYAMRYDRAAFGGLPKARFEQALTAETGFPFHSLHEPLNASPLYKPLSKRRHRLGAEHEAALDPRRFVLPECDRAHQEVVLALHWMLLAERSAMEAIAEAVAKIQRHAEELLDNSRHPAASIPQLGTATLAAKA